MMKRSVQSHLSLRSKPFFSPILFFFSSSASSTPSPSSVGTARTRKMNLTREELTKINLLIPRLCESNHLPEAIRLVAAALLLSTPPLESLSLSLLIDRLASQPDMAQPMSLLNRLKHTPSPYPSLQPIAHMLLSSYLRKRRLKEAIKVLNWMSRPDSPSPPDNALYALVIGGLCTNHMGLEALKVLQAMLVAGLVPGNELRMRLYGVLLAEAMIGEARELNEALKSAASDGDSVGKVLALLDHLILNWID